MIEVSSYPPGCSSVPGDEPGDGWLDELIKALQKRMEDYFGHKNPECWPLGSFGGKDADLEPDGCTGIRAYDGINVMETELYFTVGGHKTLTDPFFEEFPVPEVVPEDYYHERLDIMGEQLVDIMQGFCCEGSSEGWDCSFSDRFTVQIVMDDEKAEVDIMATVETIITQAGLACEKFSAATTAASDMVDSEYRQLIKDYGEARDEYFENLPN